MLKKHARIKFIIIALIAILGILLCVCPFSIPSSTNMFAGFVPAVNKGIELSGGVEVSYKAELKEGATISLEDALDDAKNKVYDLYSVAGYSELFVNKVGDDKLSILMSSEARVGDDGYEYLQTSKPVHMTLTEATDSTGDIREYVVGADIKAAKASYDQNSQKYGIYLHFTQTGLEHIETMKSNAEKNAKVYIYCGDVESANLRASVAIDEVKEGMFVTAESLTSSNIGEYAHNIMAGSMAVTLSNVASAKVSPSLGENSNLYIAIALISIIVVSMMFMYARYGHFGLLGSLSLVFYLVFFAFLMQAIPLVTMNLIGVIACVVAYLIAVVSHCYIFEKIKDEYASGKKIHIACKGGFRKALWPIIDSHVVAALAAICIWIFAPSAVKVFGIAILTGAVLSLVASMGLIRGFVSLYLPLNTSKPQKLRLYRDKNVKEVKEDEVEIIPEDQVNSQMMEGENE